MSYEIPPETPITLTRQPKPNKKRQYKNIIILLGFFSILVMVGSVALFTYLFRLTQTKPVTVIVGGEARAIHTRAETVNVLLADLNILPFEGDSLSVDIDTPIYEGMVLRLERARNVIIQINGQSRYIRTTLANPAEILTYEGITLASDDLVLLDGTRTDPLSLSRWPVPVNQIAIRRAVPVTIVDNGLSQVIRTTGETVVEALYDGDITLYVADDVFPTANTAITENMTITIQRSIPVSVIADGVTLETRTQGESVADLLADAEVILMGLDYSVPDEDTLLNAGDTVRVVRVFEENIIEDEIIPFESISQGDPSIELDQTRLIQPGQNGLRRSIIRVRYENGIETNRSIGVTETVREPQSRIVGYGTGIVLRTIETEQGPREYWRKMRVLVTSYHPAALGGDNITATGQTLTKGIVGVDPTIIPYGTRIYVPGYGIGVAADTGPPRSTRLWIDLGYDDENFVPWSGYTDLYVLTPLPGNFPYILPAP